MQFHSVGKALPPTYASASTFKCSNRTSIVGRSRDYAYRSMRSFSFDKSFSLSSSAMFTSLSNNLLSSTMAPPSSSFSIPLLARKYDGSLSSAANFRASSSSFSRQDVEKTSIPVLLHMLELLLPILALLVSPNTPPSIITYLLFLAVKENAMVINDEGLARQRYILFHKLAIINRKGF